MRASAPPIRRAILLAAGFGTRLRPITKQVPKCLVPIGGQPLLGFWLHMLKHACVDEILVNAHYLASSVEQYLAEQTIHPNVKLHVEKELLGTAGTLSAHLGFWEKDRCIVAHADNLCWVDFATVNNRHVQSVAGHGAILSMLTFNAEDPTKAGVVEIDENRVLTKFHEKVANPPSSLANAAIYVFEPGMAKYVSALSVDQPDISLDLIPSITQPVFVHEPLTYLRDVGSLASYAQAQIDFLNHPSLAVVRQKSS